jgi:hypothetical protein
MRLKILFLFVFLSFFASCGSESEDPQPHNIVIGETPTETISQDSLNRIQNGIFIKYNGTGSPTITNTYEKVKIETNGANVVVTSEDESTEYNFIVSGATTAGSLKIYGEHKIGLYLNGASITNPNGPAINIQNGKKITEISVRIIGQKSSLKGRRVDGEDEDAKGAFFSEGKLIFSGGSTLEVTGEVGHAIKADNYLEMNGGCIVVKESARDGIHANYNITINGGLIYISSKGDAIQSDSSVFVYGGKIKAQTNGVKSHGISSEGKTKISGNATEVNLEVFGDGSKGIKSKDSVKVDGGTIKIKTNGTTYTVSEDEENKTTGIKTDGDMEISGGDLTIESKGVDAKGIKTNRVLDINGGKVTITAHHRAIKTDGNLYITGGDVSLTSTNKAEVIESKNGENGITISIKKVGKNDY